MDIKEMDGSPRNWVDLVQVRDCLGILVNAGLNLRVTKAMWVVG
jgi:hypothetical protein